jgi:hypothetical protein
MENYHSNYYGLIFNCPMGLETASCGYKNIRHLSIKERLNYIDVLTESKKKILVENHQQCLLVREKKSLFHESQ